MKLNHARNRNRRRRLFVERCEPRNLLATVELVPLADATIYETESNGNSSNGAGDHLIAGVTGANGGFTTRRALIRFDLSSIPAGAIVDSAVFELTASLTAPGSGNRDVSLFPLLSDWGEGPSDPPGPEGLGVQSQVDDSSWLYRFYPTVPWALDHGGDFNPAFSSATTSVGQPGRYSWSSADLNADVEEWVAAPDTNFGWIILGDEFELKSARRFESRENPNEANRPKLTVEYSIPTISGPSGPINGDPFNVTIDFNEPVTEFVLEDLQVTDGEVKSLTDQGEGVYVASIEPSGEGTLTVELPSQAAVKPNGATTAAAEPFVVDVDTTSPTPVFDGPDSPHSSQRFDVQIDFAEIVTGFELSDIRVGNGVVETLGDDGNGKFTASVLGNAGSTVTLDVDAGAANDLAGNPNLAASRFSVTIPDPTEDFGDAPNTFPVTLADDGARHTTGSLFLGSAVDAELDGVPSSAADSDTDDGIAGITTLVAAQSETLATISVTASQSGQLDGWLDFNGDGDWDDAGEQIFDSVVVEAGQNELAIMVPTTAVPGNTFMRLRLSTSGGLNPTGAAATGEVEDHAVVLEDESQPHPISVPITTSPVIVAIFNGELVISSPAGDLFRSPALNVDSFKLLGSEGDDVVNIDLDSVLIPPGGLDLQGNGGTNTVRLLGNSIALDLTPANIQIRDFDRIDLSPAGLVNLLINDSAITEMQPQDEEVELLLGEGDAIQVSQPSNWRMQDPVIVDGNFRLVALHEVGNQQMEIESPYPWQNPIRASDVNNSGNVTAGDALIIINELARRGFSQADGELDDPLSLQQWPGIYYDQSADGRVSALDALRVINRLSVAGEAEGEAFFGTDSLPIAGEAAELDTEIAQAVDEAIVKICDFTAPGQSSSQAQSDKPVAVEDGGEGGMIEAIDVDLNEDQLGG